MPNMFAQSLVVGAISFAAAVSVSYLLWGDAKPDAPSTLESTSAGDSDRPADSELDELEARLKALEAKRATPSQPAAPHEDQASLLETISSRVLRLEEADRALDAKLEERDKAALTRESLREEFPKVLQEVRRQEALTKYAKEVVAFKAKAAELLPKALEKTLGENKLSEVQNAELAKAYQTRLEGVYYLFEDVQLGREMGLPLSKEEIAARFAEEVSNHNAAIAQIVGQDALEAVQNAVASADWYASKAHSGAGFSEQVFRAMNPEVMARKEAANANGK